MTKVLITGGAGFIGHHLAVAWRRRGAEVVVLDNFRTGRRENLASALAEVGGHGITLVEGSITDAARVRSAMKGCAVVHHLAAQVSVPESVAAPRECVDINVGGTLEVLEAAKAEGVSRVVFSSSAAVYGDDPRMPKTEDMAPSPKSPYGVTKLDGEYYVRMYSELHGVPGVSLRYFNVFGPRQDPRSVYAAAVPIFLEKALRGAPLTVFGDGQQTRDFVFVEDVCAANILAAVSPEAGGGEVFNVGNGATTTIADLAREIAFAAGKGSPVVFGPDRPGDIRHSRADISAIRSALGFEPSTSLATGLERAIEALRSVGPK